MRLGATVPGNAEYLPLEARVTELMRQLHRSRTIEATRAHEVCIFLTIRNQILFIRLSSFGNRSSATLKKKAPCNSLPCVWCISSYSQSPVIPRRTPPHTNRVALRSFNTIVCATMNVVPTSGKKMRYFFHCFLSFHPSRLFALLFVICFEHKL